MITHNLLNDIFDYNPCTGIVTWRNPLNTLKHNVGDIVGSRSKDGYLNVKIQGKQYRLHRIIWFIVEGYMPEYQIDHINRIRDDNRFANLRHVTPQCNVRNVGKRRDNTSGVTGVSVCKKTGKWKVSITVNKKQKHLGLYKDLLDAAVARWEAEKRYEFPNCNSTSTAYLYLINNQRHETKEET